MPIIRSLSCGPMPAMGSSSTSKRGFMASAAASSSWRRSPWESASTRVCARAASPTRASASMAGARRLASDWAARKKRQEWPCCACTANATLSSAEKSAQSWVIWNERPNPASARFGTLQPVMSAPKKAMRPASGLISPVIWPMSVDLPAPLGPMIAWRSLASTLRVTLSVARRAPKLLVRPVRVRTAVMARPLRG